MIRQTQLTVVEKGAHYVAVLKPYNMVVVTGRGAPKPTMLDILRKQISEAVRPVHRLDRVTTGICLFATSLFGQQALSSAFRRRLIHKRYLAIVHGIPKWKQLNIDAPLKREDTPDARKGPLASQTIDEDEGKRALTRVKVLATQGEFTLIEANPETGRMHQIRAHLAHVGFPIVGDKNYGSKQRFIEDQPHAIGLLAWKVDFPVPGSKGRKTLEAPVPEAFIKLVHMPSTHNPHGLLF